MKTVHNSLTCISLSWFLLRYKLTLRCPCIIWHTSKTWMLVYVPSIVNQPEHFAPAVDHRWEDNDVGGGRCIFWLMSEIKIPKSSQTEIEGNVHMVWRVFFYGLGKIFLDCKRIFLLVPLLGGIHPDDLPLRRRSSGVTKAYGPVKPPVFEEVEGEETSVDRPGENVVKEVH